MNEMVELIKSVLLKSFTFKGRATRKEFWSFILFFLCVQIVVNIISFLTVGSRLGTIWMIISLIIFIALLIPYISVAVRRLHDLGLSGFWFWYLNPLGLPVVFVVYLLDLDQNSNKIIDKIQKIGSPWLGWILTWLFWPVGAFAAQLLLFLYAGKDEANEFGPSPYSCCKAECGCGEAAK